jgi:phosphatidate phosphatase APP1
MPNWTLLRDIAGALIDDAQRLGLSVLAGGDASYEIVPYRGYGTPSRVLVQGRAARTSGVMPSRAHDTVFANLLNTYRRIGSEPLRHAHIAVRVGGAEREVVADDEGFFREWVELTGGAHDRATDAPTLRDLHGGSRAVDLRLLEPLRPDQPHVGATAAVRVPRPDSSFGVISDLDDTVIQSSVSSFLHAARTIATGNAHTRLPFQGVADVYRALERGGDGTRENPIFYVSSSPWNLYDVIVDFLAIQRIPEGPVLLRDWDIRLDALTSRGHQDHKEPLIREILDTYPSLPFILVGDTSQHDPEIYRGIVGAYPHRILAIYIRDVTLNPARAAAVEALAREVQDAGVALVLTDDTAVAARHAAERGWIVG